MGDLLGNNRYRNEEQDITIPGTTSDVFCGNAGTGARPVFDDDLLAEVWPCAGAKNTGNYIGGGSSREADD
jgi:hypothetical protein